MMADFLIAYHSSLITPEAFYTQNELFDSPPALCYHRADSGRTPNFDFNLLTRKAL